MAPDATAKQPIISKLSSTWTVAKPLQVLHSLFIRRKWAGPAVTCPKALLCRFFCLQPPYSPSCSTTTWVRPRTPTRSLQTWRYPSVCRRSTLSLILVFFKPYFACKTNQLHLFCISFFREVFYLLNATSWKNSSLHALFTKESIKRQAKESRMLTIITKKWCNKVII